VSLIVYYLGFVLVGDLADYLIGLIVERQFGSHASLIIFLALYAVVLWVAVRIRRGPDRRLGEIHIGG
jgi:hypothetical protein